MRRANRQDREIEAVGRMSVIVALISCVQPCLNLSEPGFMVPTGPASAMREIAWPICPLCWDRKSQAKFLDHCPGLWSVGHSWLPKW